MLQTTLIGRQPIFNGDGELYAYELLFRDSEVNRATITDNHTATSKVVADTLNTFGLSTLVGHHQAFINIDHSFLHDHVIETIPPQSFVLEILETVEVDDKLLQRVVELKKLGYRFALDDIHLGDEQMENFRPLFEYISIVKVDMLLARDYEKIRVKMRAFAAHPIAFLAEKVEDVATFERCKELGFTYFQGYFFAKPNILEGKKMDPAQATVIQLITMLQEEKELHHLAEAFKPAPELTINLCRYINSSTFMTRKDICSVPQAISMLGRQMLLRWLTLSLYSSSKREKLLSPLMETAMVRAEMMSMFAIRYGMEQKMVQKAYLVGLISLLDALLHTPFKELFGMIPFHKKIRHAVMDREGELGRILNIVLLIEEGNEENIHRMLKKIKMHETELSAILTQCYYMVGSIIRTLV